MILLGITGGVAAYKSADLASTLTQKGYQVEAVLTFAAKHFIGAATLGAVTRRPVHGELFTGDSHEILHIDLADRSDLIVIAPATADIIAKLAAGLADDLLTTTILAAKKQVLVVPAMNPNMWNHPATKANLKKIQDYGYEVINPEVGRMACEHIGEGRYPKNEVIISKIESLLAGKSKKKTPLNNKKVLITYGPVYSPIDPVRVISNLSSGKMGQAFVTAARDLGAKVTEIAGGEYQKFKKELLDCYSQNDIVIMAAAVSDYEVDQPHKQKIKKSNNRNQTLSLELNPTEDLLALIGNNKKKTVVIGFALETENLIGNAQKKLKEKNCDYIVANDQKNLGSDNARVTLIKKNGKTLTWGPDTKLSIARQVLDEISREIF
jgi:phosphopantothenoylcysteine decarboxylase/phosphopantothenate--cysteine ligase